MFQFFFEDYRQIYYANKKEKNIYWPEWIIFGIIIALCIGYIHSAVKEQTMCMWFFFIFMVGFLFGLRRVHDGHMKKTHNDRMLKYKEKEIHQLEELLNKEDYKFMSLQKIDWLISSCETRLEIEKNPFSGFSDSFFRFVFPFITLLIGALVKSISIEFATALIVLVLAVWFIALALKEIMGELTEKIFCPNRSILIALGTDLKYIRITLDDYPQTGTEENTEVPDGGIVSENRKTALLS